MRWFLPLLTAMLTAGPACMARVVLPVPPVPPPHPALAAPAPVPNVYAQAPIAPLSDEPSIAVRLYRSRSFDPSAGFVPGSRFQSSEDRKPIQTPGFSVTVPLK